MWERWSVYTHACTHARHARYDKNWHCGKWFIITVEYCKTQVRVSVTHGERRRG